MRTRDALRIAAAGIVMSAAACGDQSVGGWAALDGGAPEGDDAGTFSLDGSGGNDAGCGIHCSTDLHEVLACDESVLLTCPDDQGCAAGGCVDPCTAARANGSAQGCEFYSVMPAIFAATGGEKTDNDTGSCFAAMVANTWKQAITLNVDYDGKALDISQIARSPKQTSGTLSFDPLPNGTLGPGEMALLFLAGKAGSATECPAGITAGVENGATLATGRGRAFHIVTTAPVAAYDIFPYGGAKSYISSATLLVPTSAWGTNYIADDAYASPPATNVGPVNNFGPFIQIVATLDDTHVTIRPIVDVIAGAGIDPAAAEAPHTYSLARGEVLQLVQPTELAGSPIAADKPVSVWGGHTCMNIPFDSAACDGAHQELLPVNALGSEYVAVRYRDRTSLHETIPWTMTGTVDGTTLTYEPSRPYGAPQTLGSGEVREIQAAEPFVVRSDPDHPFHLAAHMTGATIVSGETDDQSDTGDPDFVSSVPSQQWLGSYVFLTDPTYRNSHLVFVRQKGKDGAFHDVTLDCTGPLTGWTAVNAGGAYELARIDITKAGSSIAGCKDGIHTAKSDIPFGLTVWGWDNAVSYAYPAGMGVRPINSVVVPVVK